MSKDKSSLDQLMRDAWNDPQLSDGDMPMVKTPYHYYKLAVSKLEEPDNDLLVDDPNEHCVRAMTEEEFYWRLERDSNFESKWK